MGGQDGCDRRSEVFVKIQKDFFLGGEGGRRVGPGGSDHGLGRGWG